MPVTIKLLEDANQPNPEDTTFEVDGVPLSQVRSDVAAPAAGVLVSPRWVLPCPQVAIVGSITQVQSKSTNTVYTIDDGTGQIDVMFWTTGEESEQQLKKKELWA